MCIKGYNPGVLQESLSIHMCSFVYHGSVGMDNTAGTRYRGLQYSVIEEHDMCEGEIGTPQCKLYSYNNEEDNVRARSNTEKHVTS